VPDRGGDGAPDATELDSDVAVDGSEAGRRAWNSASCKVRGCTVTPAALRWLPADELTAELRGVLLNADRDGAARGAADWKPG
jgi:hypothetical protein